MPETLDPVFDVHLRPEELREAMERDAVVGLTADEKWLPPVWFYDDRGSELFDEITRLAEYYPTRAERRLLVENAAEIARLSGADTLLELGAGTCDKSRIILDALRSAGSLQRFVPVDVSEGTLRWSAATLAPEYSGVEIHGVVADFARHLRELPDGGRRMVAFLGGTVGNFDPAQRRRFYFDLDCVLTHGDSFLLGTDLVKDVGRLVAAYDDASGVTAAFNRNVLHVLNRELGANFDVEAFDHVARWNAEESWIEMRLRSTRPQTVRLAALDLEVEFASGEELRTEISAKFTREQVHAELWAAGFVVDAMWDQPEGDFLLTLAHPYC